MRKLLYAAVLGISTCPNLGCIIPPFSGDPPRRTQQLLYVSENLRNLTDEWERFWLLDQPCHMSPYRTHGGIL
jgi:hypothetical protein